MEGGRGEWEGKGERIGDREERNREREEQIGEGERGGQGSEEEG